jgi:hypothetical protein
MKRNNIISFAIPSSLHVVWIAASLCAFAKCFCLCGRLLAGFAEVAVVLLAMSAFVVAIACVSFYSLRDYLRAKATGWIFAFSVFAIVLLPLDIVVAIGAVEMARQAFRIGDEFFADDLPVLPEEISIKAFENDVEWPEKPVDERPVRGIECYSSPRACIAYFNTMEPGISYLRAYEITTGRRLSAKSITNQTRQSVRWSDDAATAFCHVFTYNIMEGVVEHPYRARIEVWFVPDSGAPERKILEKVCVVSGSHHDC